MSSLVPLKQLGGGLLAVPSGGAAATMVVVDQASVSEQACDLARFFANAEWTVRGALEISDQARDEAAAAQEAYEEQLQAQGEEGLSTPAPPSPRSFLPEEKRSTLVEEAEALVEKRDLVGLLKKIVVLIEESFGKNAEATTEGVALFIVLLTKLEQESQIDELGSELCEALVRVKSTDTASQRFALLTQLFLALAPTSNVRATVLVALIDLAPAAKAVSIILATLPSIGKQLDQWGVDKKAQGAHFWRSVEFLKNAGYDRRALNFAIKFLETLDDSTSDGLEIGKIARQVAIDAIKLPTIAHVQPILDLPAVKKLSASEPQLHQLLGVFASGTVKDFETFASTNSAAIATYGFDHDDLLAKIRSLALADLAKTSPELSYADIASGVGVSEDEVEDLVIVAVERKILDARMDDERRVVSVRFFAQRTFGKEDWETIGDRLKSWEGTIGAMLDSLRQNANAAPSR